MVWVWHDLSINEICEQVWGENIPLPCSTIFLSPDNRNENRKKNKQTKQNKTKQKLKQYKQHKKPTFGMSLTSF